MAAKAKGRTRARTPSKKERLESFLKELGETGLVKQACENSGIGRSTVYEERQRNEDFALAWHDIEEETTEAMEREAIRRGAEGVKKPVYQGGKLVGHVQEYSDTLMIFMLKARRPEVYREKTRHEHTGPDGGPVVFADLMSVYAGDEDEE